MDIQFIGEHLRPGQLGHFFVITCFASALFSAFSYYNAAHSELKDINGSRTWLSLGRNGFIIHAASVFAIFITLFYIISSHLFEYHYAWRHSSLALPPKYLLSCFWEGQEGSFLLWTLWHCVLGLIVMRTSKVMESRVMAIIAMVQALLATMLLGFYFSAEVKLGSDPFMLLRHHMQGAPIFSQPNYMNFIQDGNGLNVLLQNYWMVIHPPVLFLGFASTLIPFSYVIAALWKRDYETWIKPTINWSLFSGAVLGTGIMMGGAWAYESLTFGGYWAWDPVENASLVPWLVMIGGLHTLIVYKATGRALTTTFILFMLSYLLVWYSTFLTRTGILGDTSVHAFTDEGKSLYWHLLSVMGLLKLLCIFLLVRQWKTIPRIKTEEDISSREFWMFIGSIILLLSASQIIFATSLPVWAPVAKWITGKDIAPPVDSVTRYNNVQVWVAILVALLSATGLYMRFKQSDWKMMFRRLGLVTIIAAAMAAAIGFAQNINAWQYATLLFAASFAIVANVYYSIAIKKGNIKKMGATIAHLGFAMMLMGILLSSFKKEVISFNTVGLTMDFGKKTHEDNVKESRENTILFLNTPVAMGDYSVTYKGDSTSDKDPRTFFKVYYERRDSATKALKEAFVLYPDAFINPKGQEGLIANPASKHYWKKDIFTYVTQVLNPSKKTDTATYQAHELKQGDSLFFNNGYMVFRGFETNINDHRYTPETGDIAVASKLDVYDANGLVKNIKPIYYIRHQYESYVEDTLKDAGIYIRFAKVLPEKGAAQIMLKETNPKDDYIVLKAMVFPYINVLWLGTIIMVIGFFISIWNRLTKKDKVRV